MVRSADKPVQTIVAIVEFALTTLQFEPKRFDRRGGICRLFQVRLHGGSSTAFCHTINTNYILYKMLFHKRNSSFQNWVLHGI